MPGRGPLQAGSSITTPLRSRYRDFGGIRIEDDILVTESGSRMPGDKKIPVTVEELEAVVGR